MVGEYTLSGESLAQTRGKFPCSAGRLSFLDPTGLRASWNEETRFAVVCSRHFVGSVAFVTSCPGLARNSNTASTRFSVFINRKTLLTG